MDGLGLGWDLCVGLLYEHRFAVLITIEIKVAMPLPECCEGCQGDMAKNRDFSNVSRKYCTW